MIQLFSYYYTASSWRKLQLFAPSVLWCCFSQRGELGSRLALNFFPLPYLHLCHLRCFSASLWYLKLHRNVSTVFS